MNSILCCGTGEALKSVKISISPARRGFLSKSVRLSSCLYKFDEKIETYLSLGNLLPQEFKAITARSSFDSLIMPSS